MTRSPVSMIAAMLALATATAPAAHAETLNCTPITSVPVEITTQGIYCFTQHVGTSISTGIAILISVNNVILDLNGYKLQGTNAGTGTLAVGILTADHRNVTIRNGTVRGFAAGIFLSGRGHVIEDVRLDFNTQGAINVSGVGNVIRNNVIVATGGSTTSPNNSPNGILVSGSLHRVLNNEVLDTFPTGTGFATSISIGSGQGVVVEANRIGNSSLPPAGAQTRGIQVGVEASNALLVNNRFTLLTFPIFCLTGNTAKIRDNLSTGSGAYTGCLDVGNNQ
jgi:hypothetical protein